MTITSHHVTGSRRETTVHRWERTQQKEQQQQSVCLHNAHVQSSGAYGKNNIKYTNTPISSVDSSSSTIFYNCTRWVGGGELWWLASSSSCWSNNSIRLNIPHSLVVAVERWDTLSIYFSMWISGRRAWNEKAGKTKWRRKTKQTSCLKLSFFLFPYI